MKNIILKDEIYKHGFTIKSFAEHVGLSRFSIIDLTSGRVKKPRGDTIKIISDGLEMPYEDVKNLFVGYREE